MRLRTRLDLLSQWRGKTYPYVYLWQEPVLGIFGSQRPASLETPFLCPSHLAHSVVLASATPAPEQLKRKARTFSGQDGGPATACSCALVSLSRHLSSPPCGPQHTGKREQRGIHTGGAHISRTLGLVLGGTWLSSKGCLILGL